MGLFSGIKAMGDIVKGGIDAFKATEKMDQFVEESRKDYKEEMTDMDNKLYKDYKKLKDAHAAEKDIDKANAMIEKVEAAEAAYLMSLTHNKDLPKAFRREVQEAINGYIATNSDEAMYGIVEKAMLRYAKNDEEKETIRKTLKETKDSDK